MNKHTKLYGTNICLKRKSNVWLKAVLEDHATRCPDGRDFEHRRGEIERIIWDRANRASEMNLRIQEGHYHPEDELQATLKKLKMLLDENVKQTESLSKGRTQGDYFTALGKYIPLKNELAAIMKAVNIVNKYREQ